MVLTAMGHPQLRDGKTFALRALCFLGVRVGRLSRRGGIRPCSLVSCGQLFCPDVPLSAPLIGAALRARRCRISSSNELGRNCALAQGLCPGFFRACRGRNPPRQGLARPWNRAILPTFARLLSFVRHPRFSLTKVQPAVKQRYGSVRTFKRRIYAVRVSTPPSNNVTALHTPLKDGNKRDLI